MENNIMTQEEKSLLLQDLCARLPYGLLIDTTRGAFELDAISRDLISLKDKEGRLSDLLQFTDGKYWFPIVSGNYKPYLRPMSSMTDEEEIEMTQILEEVYDSSFTMDKLVEDVRMQEYIPSKYVDWLNKHHFDYRGLIPKGLALPAPDGMYIIK